MSTANQNDDDIWNEESNNIVTDLQVRMLFNEGYRESKAIHEDRCRQSGFNIGFFKGICEGKRRGVIFSTLCMIKLQSQKNNHADLELISEIEKNILSKDINDSKWLYIEETVTNLTTKYMSS